MNREEEADLSFADFGSGEGSKRLYTSPTVETTTSIKNAPDLSSRGRSQNLEHETGLEPATSTLAKGSERKK